MALYVSKITRIFSYVGPVKKKFYKVRPPPHRVQKHLNGGSLYREKGDKNLDESSPCSIEDISLALLNVEKSKLMFFCFSKFMSQ